VGIRGKIIRTVLCCIVYGSCARLTHTYEQLLKLTVVYVFFTFRFVFCMFLPFRSCVVCFCCVRFSFFSTEPRDMGQEERLRNYAFCVEWEAKH